MTIVRATSFFFLVFWFCFGFLSWYQGSRLGNDLFLLKLTSTGDPLNQRTLFWPHKVYEVGYFYQRDGKYLLSGLDGEVTIEINDTKGRLSEACLNEFIEISFVVEPGWPFLSENRISYIYEALIYESLAESILDPQKNQYIWPERTSCTEGNNK